MKSQLADMDLKLDALSSQVGAMHEDVKRLAGRPMLEVYDEWSDRTKKAAGSQLPSEGVWGRSGEFILHLYHNKPPTFQPLVYIEAEVVGPGPKANFEADPKINPSEAVTSAFAKFMESKANVLLLSGAAGSGKSTTYSKLQAWVLREYAAKRKKEVRSLVQHGVHLVIIRHRYQPLTHYALFISQDINVVLLPVSLPQLRDPINGIFREGLELAYDRALRPTHADELREMVQDPESKTEIVFFLDAYDGAYHCLNRMFFPPSF